MKKFFVIILATIFPVAAMQQRDPRMALSFVLNAVALARESCSTALPEETTQINCVPVDKQFKCSYPDCSYVAKQWSSFVAHKIIHKGKKPPIDTTHLKRTFIQCAYCDYSTRRYGDMTRHIRTHTGEKPYKCEFCSFKTARRMCLVYHVRSKHSEKAPQ